MRTLTLVPMSVREAPHQVIADMHGDRLREISALVCVHWLGLSQAARVLRKRNMIDGTQAKKHSLLGGDYNLSSLFTVISSNQFRYEHQQQHQTICWNTST